MAGVDAITAAPPPTGFFHYAECPPGREGCVRSRTVTDERVTDLLSCPAGYSSYVGGHALRRLVVGDIEAVGALADRGVAELRGPLVLHVNELEACMRALAFTQRIDVRLVIAAPGNVLSASNNSDLACIDTQLRALHFGRSTESTLVRAHLEYTVEDPSDYAVKPLHCP